MNNYSYKAAQIQFCGLAVAFSGGRSQEPWRLKAAGICEHTLQGHRALWAQQSMEREILRTGLGREGGG